jgi:hypothetical protein
MAQIIASGGRRSDLPFFLRIMPKRESGRRVTPREARSLLNQPGVKRDSELSELQGMSVYQLPTGEMLIFDDGDPNGAVWASRTVLRQIYAADPMKEPRHLLADLIPDARIFVNEIDRWLSRLEELVPRAGNILFPPDKSRIIGLDEVVNELGADRCLSPDVFPALCAYAGEIMRQATNGRWEARLGADGKTWEPWIVDDHRSYNPFVILWDELTEQSDEDRSFASAIAGELESHKLKRRR